MLALTAFLFVLTVSSQDSQRPDLTGTVRVQGGEPVENASVFIYTAQPRKGFSPL